MIADRVLRDLLPMSLTSIPCVSIQRQAKIEEAIGLLIPYLESMADSLVVTGDNNQPIGMVGGKEIIEKVLANPSRSIFQGEIETIMSTIVTRVSGTTTVRDTIRDWEKTGRAFSLIPNAIGGFSVIQNSIYPSEADLPPSMFRIVPVIHLASSDAKNTAALDTSSGSPIRLSGWRSSNTLRA